MIPGEDWSVVEFAWKGAVLAYSVCFVSKFSSIWGLLDGMKLKGPGWLGCSYSAYCIGELGSLSPGLYSLGSEGVIDPGTS